MEVKTKVLKKKKEEKNKINIPYKTKQERKA